MAASPGSDNNCNIYMPPIGICSVASSHDFSDYQWLSDFGYRDGAPTHQSILSALSASYNGIGELSYYEKMAKDIDANLAEIDMESFRTEDMHSLLTGLPPAGQQQLLVDDMERKARNNNRIFSTANGGCTGTGLITVDMMDNSICKSELLFSPVKESHISVDSLDMDGYPDEEDIILTCQANKNNYTIAFEQSVLYSDESFYDGPENYGKYKRMNLLNNLQSCSRFFKNRESAMSHSEVGYTTWSKVKRNGPAQRVPIAINPLISHISRHARTCFVRKSLSMPNLQENQISQNQSPTHHALPNGQQPLNVSQAATTGTGAAATEPYDRPLRTLLPMYTLPTDSENESTNNEGSGDDGKGRDASHDHRCEQSDQQHEDDQHQQQHQQQQQPSFNLVKLFIKQKSSSTDTCMDVSSGCWPSDSTNESGGSTGDHHHLHHQQQQQRLGGRIKKNSMNDSGKCSSTMLGGPNATDNDEDDREDDDEEEEFQLDSLDAQINNLNNNAAGSNEDAATGVNPAARRAAASGPLAQAKLNDFNRQMPCSPRRQYKGYNMNIGGRKGMGGKIPSTIHSSGSSGMASSPQSSINSSHHHHQSNNHGNNVNNNNSYKDTNSDASRTSENLTQIFNHSGNNNTTTTRHSAKTVPLEMITKSMQTSLTVSGATGAIGGEKVRVIPPSFLDRLNELGDRQKAPVFVVYPNYVLPDLGFLKPQSNEVVLSPLSFRETMSTAGGGKGAALLGATRKARPVSLNDIETIKQREYRHVADWKSLVFLLPTDYRKLLRHIPEVSELAISTESRPMFCQTPPLRRAGGGVGGGRGTIACDCMTLLQQNTQTYASSSSGGSSSAAPSSGYRGSSTMLTTGDSEMDLLGPSGLANGGAGTGNGLYVYQYDSPAEVLGSFDRPPSGRLGGAGPKSILRRPKAKRNSMFEEEQSIADHHAPSPSSIGVREKRRSLQEHHSYNFYEEEEAERSEQKLHNSPNMTPHPRLANTPKLPSADHYHKLNKLVELSERELLAAGGGDGPATAHSSGHATEEELEARARAEHFLSHVPRAELKHYAEIAHILESTEGIGADAGGAEHGASEEAYDRTRLRNEVSRALSQRRNVTFTPAPGSTPHAAVAKGTPPNTTTTPVRQAPSASSPSSALLRPTDIKFSTPPNSPNNMSVMAAAHNGAPGSTKVAEKKPPLAQQRNGGTCTEKEKQNKIETNRFKRLQIQWELLSKEAHGRAAAENQRRMEIRSGGNTPTGGSGGINGANKSRIPRPVSYPTTRTNSDPVVSKTLKSPSRIAPPRRYPGANIQSPQTHGTTTATTPPTPAPRTPSRTYGNITTTTPKKVSSVPSRPATRTRIPLVNRGKKVAIK
ncbi:uncharacterized protein LOC126579117 isoform X2 [Anopheles aquasalis]|uniref:uncharacterized protein LOC126579117 isoform X2 n=1 Tax=Anopheles aquasalis TaxID=42839 RepID=UPI00215A16DD|nr:uncharacterized protein LOC126579117 isoform X2 [Anopheles aquasalis]